MTHTTKHTPGPWIVDTASISGDRIVKGASDQTIAQLHWHTASDANAHLIAAAPAMYEALQATMAYFMRSNQSHAPEVRVIRATLAQAEGQQL